MRPEAPGLWASAGINKQRLDGGGGAEEGGPSWFPDAGLTTARGTQGGSLWLCLHRSLLPTRETLSFLRGHQIFRAEMVELPGEGEQPLPASR